MDQKTTSSNIKQDNGKEMEKGRTSSTGRLPSEKGGERLKMLQDNLEAILQDYEKHKAFYGSQMRELQEDREKIEEQLRDLEVAMMREPKSDARILELKDELEVMWCKSQALRKRIIARKLHIGEQNICSLKYLITTAKGAVLEDDIAGNKIIDGMEEKLRKVEACVESLKI